MTYLKNTYFIFLLNRCFVCCRVKSRQICNAPLLFKTHHCVPVLRHCSLKELGFLKCHHFHYKYCGVHAPSAFRIPLCFQHFDYTVVGTAIFAESLFGALCFYIFPQGFQELFWYFFFSKVFCQIPSLLLEDLSVLLVFHLST